MSRVPLHYRLLERGTRLLNRLIAPKVQAPATGELYSRIYLEHIRSWLEDITPDGRRLRILDAGCGAGRLAVPLADDGHHVVGVDYHDSSLRAAREAAGAAGVEVEFVQGELQKYLAGRSRDEFDAVLCLEVLYTCTNYREILNDIQRVIRPGGHFIGSFATPFYLITTLLRQGRVDAAVQVATGREGIVQLARVPAYYNWNTRDSLTGLLADLGFGESEIHPVGVFSGHGSDGMAGVFNLGELRDADALEAMFRLETVPGDYGSAARYLLVRTSVPTHTEGSA